jgi:hypothetical protein
MTDIERMNRDESQTRKPSLQDRVGLLFLLFAIEPIEKRCHLRIQSRRRCAS